MPIGYVMQTDGKVKVIPDRISGKRVCWEELMKTPTSTVWREVKGDLSTLAQFCTALWQEVFYGPMDIHTAIPRDLHYREDPAR
jgi:hypothetical protein